MVALLLLASCGLDAWLYLRLRRERAAAAAAAAARAPRERAAERCEAERRAPLAGLIRELGDRAAAAPRPAPRVERPRHDGGVGDDLARRTLCDLGREQARQRWEPWKEDVAHLMRWYLSDPGTQERKAVEKTAEIQKLLGLSSQEGHQLLGDYAGVRRERVSEVRRLIDQEPADWGGVFDQLKGLQADEDALVLKRFGAERARKLAEALREERLLLLSVMATYADRPWEDSLEK
ncbi:MAG: hypothetical protein HY906_12055 [Deltaproteobacteria bacterium]|nr:hypothetical protein [Deltaproteobacteria bacterium]